MNDVTSSHKKGVAYPNPTSGDLFIDDGDNKTGEVYEYVVYDVTGRQIGKGKGKEGQAISLDNNTSGMYMVNTKDNDGDTTNHKIIKK